MDSLKSILNFLNLLDVEGKVSITNVAVVVVLIKLSLSSGASFAEIGSLFAVLANYAHKRIHINQNQVEPEDTITPQIENMKSEFDKIQSQVSALALSSGITKLK